MDDVVEGQEATHVHTDLAASTAALPDPAAVEAAATFFRAVGDPERLRLLSLLSQGERCVTELAETRGVGLPVVSQRLRVLRGAGLVERRREGQHVWYRLADVHVADLVATALAHATEVAERSGH